MTDEPKGTPEEPKTATPATKTKSAPGLEFDQAWLQAIKEANTFKLPDLSGLANLKIPEITFPGLDTTLLTSFRLFEHDVVDLRKQVDAQARALRDEKSSGKSKEQKIAKLEAMLEELRAKERLGFLLGRVNQRAQRELLSSEPFRQRFLGVRECMAFVMSVDIRRSTELMLKARNPEAFASFITTMCSDLMGIVTEHFGVFDKFTGDGVLAFFPDFYTGDDAGYHAVAAADKCHARWRDHYQLHRSSFTSVLTEVGLGVGIDFGRVHLVQVAGGLTVVGVPVVYACRLSAAPPGLTLVNQPAYEAISERFGAKCFVEETTLDIKHEGGMLAYAVRLNGREYAPREPDWTATLSAPSKSA